MNTKGWVLISLVIALFVSMSTVWILWGFVPACIAGVALGLVVYAIIDKMVNILDPSLNKTIFYGGIWCLIPFAIIGAIVAGEWIPWPANETTNPALDAKIAKAQTARESTEKKEEEERITLTVENFARNIAGISDKIDALQKSTNDRFESNRRQMELLAKETEKNGNLLRGLIAPVPPTESKSVPPQEEPQASVPPPPEPEKTNDPPVLKWVPVPRRIPVIPKRQDPKKETPLPPKAIPKPEEIRPAEPQPTIEHRAKVLESPERKQWVVHCNCGKTHPIRGFWRYPDGTSIPDYTHCSDDFGRPCEAESYEQVVVRK